MKKLGDGGLARKMCKNRGRIGDGALLFELCTRVHNCWPEVPENGKPAFARWI